MTQVENRISYKVDRRKRKATLKALIGYTIRVEEGFYVAEAPAIGFATQGDSEEQVVELFNEAVSGLLQYLIENKSLEGFLEQHGWYIINNTYTQFVQPTEASNIQQFQLALA